MPASTAPRRQGRVGELTAALGAEFAAWGLLAGHHLLVHRAAPPRAHIALNLAAAAGSFGFARAAGLELVDLGLKREDLPRGLLQGLGAAGLVAAVIVAGAGRAPDPSLLVDDRHRGVSAGRAAVEVVLRIPMGTAATEELVHRGALLALLLRRYGAVQGTLLSSLAFGLTHVLPAFHAVERSAAGRRMAGRRGGTPAAILGTVASTAVAGLGLAWLRFRSRSILAPALVHAVANGTGYLVSRRSARRTRAA